MLTALYLIDTQSQKCIIKGEKNEKKSALTTTISILLIVACLFTLAAAGFGVKDGLAIKQYKEDDAKAADVVGDLEKAIQSLKENEAAYNEGVGTYAKGLSDYAAGQQAYNEGQATLAQGYKDYDEGNKALENGEKELAAGAQELAEGAAQLAAGKNDLEAFEAGMALVDEYTMVCYKNEPIYRHNGEMAVPGPEQRLGIITAVLTVGCNIFGLLTRYHGYTYPLKDGSYSGTLQLIAIITFALVSVVFLIVTAAAKNEAEKQARIEA